MLTRNFAVDVRKHLTPRSDRFSVDNLQHQTVRAYPPSGGSVLVSEADYRVSKNEWEYHGYDVPDYHVRKRNGELMPFTPWEHYEYSYNSGGVYDFVLSSNYHYIGTPAWTPYDPWPISKDFIYAYVPTGDLRYLCTEAMSKIYKNGFDLFTNLAEFTSVVRMFRSVAKRLADFITYMPYFWRKLSYKRLMSMARDVNNDWLQSRYGWRILMYDVLNLHKALVDLNDKRRRFSERSGFQQNYAFDDSFTQDTTHYVLTHVVHREINVSVRGSVVSDIEYPRFQFNPFQTAWELIPLSFVVDWIFNVGNTIAGLTYACRPGNYFSSVGYKIELTQSYNNYISTRKVTFKSGDRYQATGVHAVLQRRSPCEIALSPHFTLRLNGLKVTDLLALIIQRIGHK